MSIATQGIFVLVFVLAVINLLRHPERRRLEVAVLFGVFAVSILLGTLEDASGVTVPGSGLIVALLIVTQPYLFLRLVDHFRPVPARQQSIGLALLLMSWTILLVDRMPLSSLALIAVVALFLYVEGYAIVTLIHAARITQGVARRRMVAIIAASAMLALVIFLAAIENGWPGAEAVIDPLSGVLVFGSAIGYYLGFVPPRWLRRRMQMIELARHLQLVAGRPAESRLAAALDHIGPTAMRAVGGKAAIIALGSADAQQLPIHLDPTSRELFEGAGNLMLQVRPESAALWQAWRRLQPVAWTEQGPTDADVARLASAFGGARAGLIAPLVADGTARGVIIVFQDHRTLFLEDDLALLGMLADQAVTTIESSQFIQQTQQELASRQTLLDLSQAIADETETRAVARRLAADLDTLLPSASTGVLLPLPSGELEIIATSGGDADQRIGVRIPAGSGVTGLAFSSGEPVIIDDVQADPRYIALRSAIRSELAVPLRYRDDTVGVLNLERTEVAGFSPSDVALAQIVAAHAAQSIVRAQLLERLRQQNIDLEAANRHKGEFLANMSHELRTPLNAIIGFSDLLLDDPAGTYDQETERHFLRTIHDSGEHLLSLINDILDLAKIEAGHMMLHPERVVVSDLVVQAITTLRPLADRKGIRLKSDGDGDGEITCDVAKVKQILYNLLSNAIKFTPQEGVVTVTTRRLPDAVQLTVTDTGIGISSDDQERIFQEFQQVETGADRHYEGTGLGLALTRRFVEMHGGHIWVESTPGEGSEFHVVLPSEQETFAGTPDESRDRAEVPTPIPSPATGDRPLVLVIEDDPQSANLLSLYLGRGGYRSAIVADGEQALEQARQLQPSAIALDIMLPGLDGWEVLSGLKRDEATRDIPVVIISIVDNRELGFALGATDYFVKPIDRQALLARLDRYTFTTKVRDRDVNVLLVDDEPVSIELLAGMLAQSGFGILKADGGASAITIASEQLPDFILLDLMMPEVSGFDVVDALRANPETRHIPILIVTAKDLTIEDKQRLNGRVTTILQKGSFAAVDLITWLDSALQQLNEDEGNPDGK